MLFWLLSDEYYWQCFSFFSLIYLSWFLSSVFFKSWFRLVDCGTEGLSLIIYIYSNAQIKTGIQSEVALLRRFQKFYLYGGIENLQWKAIILYLVTAYFSWKYECMACGEKAITTKTYIFPHSPVFSETMRVDRAQERGSHSFWRPGIGFRRSPQECQQCCFHCGSHPVKECVLCQFGCIFGVPSIVNIR